VVAVFGRLHHQKKLQKKLQKKCKKIFAIFFGGGDGNKKIIWWWRGVIPLHHQSLFIVLCLYEGVKRVVVIFEMINMLELMWWCGFIVSAAKKIPRKFANFLGGGDDGKKKFGGGEVFFISTTSRRWFFTVIKTVKNDLLILNDSMNQWGCVV